MKIKIVKQEGKIFLVRMSFPLRNSSIKVHLILKDDTGEAHKHPWDFTSFLILGAYKEIIDDRLIRHHPFSIIKRSCDQKHKVLLYRILNFKIPCLTIGRYSTKIKPWCEREVLCDHCQKTGICADKVYWESIKQM